MLQVDLFCLKELFHTQGNKKNKVACNYTNRKKTPKDLYKIRKDSTESQRRPTGGKHVLAGDVSFGKCDRKKPFRQPLLRTF